MLKNKPKDKLSKVKIFVGYYKPDIIFKSDVYQPILTASIDWDESNIIRDDTGINISEKNVYYAELTGHYWVWKNFLPTTDTEYIGFGHYRRFLDFNLTEMENIPFKPILISDFKKLFKKYTEQNILKCIDGYDVILPEKLPLKSILYAQYLRWHPQKDMNAALNIIRDIYPDYIDSAKLVMASTSMYSCLNFIMKKELVNEYMEWIFKLLDELDKRTDWSEYKDYMNIRTPAYITERFFNIWLEHNIKKKNLNILTTSSHLIVGQNHGQVSVQDYMLKYKAMVELFCNGDECKGSL